MRNGVALAAGLLALVMIIASCGELGRVEQGIVIDYDQLSGTMTVVRDSNPKGGDPPSYDRLPPVTVRLPSNPDDRGQTPYSGRLLSVSRERNIVVIYDPSTEAPLVIPASDIEWQGNLWADDPRVVDSALPEVDDARNTITTYLPRERALARITIPAEYSDLPRESWIPGDEVRYYYKSPSEAIRVMNLTRIAQP